MLRYLPLFCFSLIVGCMNGSADDAPDAYAPLPGVEAYLPAESYDCRASGPFVAPSRPHPLTCFSDPECAGRLAVGHRFANGFAPENTLSALRAAILLGVDIVETDLRMTSDGYVVHIHDSDVNRTTNGFGDVDALYRRPGMVA